jgi:hypothetical protein
MADPLTVACPHCGQLAGQRCASLSDWARQPHRDRIKAAEALDAYQEASNEIHYLTGD